MRVLLDECIPRVFGRELTGHDVQTAPQAALAGNRNGVLLHDAQNRFDVLITVDRRIETQQNVGSFDIAIVVIRAQSNRLESLLPHVDEVLRLLPFVQPGRVYTIPADPA